jgi:hypothetical protein
MLFTVDTDTIPTNTLNPINAVINPLTFDPTGVPVGTRYLITEDIGNKKNTDGKTAAETDIHASRTAQPTADTVPNFAQAWGTTIASANDIIQLDDAGNWVRVFDSDENTLFSDSSSFQSVQYVTNLLTGVQFKWMPDRGFWVKSYEGFYEPGTWRLEF